MKSLISLILTAALYLNAHAQNKGMAVVNVKDDGARFDFIKNYAWLDLQNPIVPADKNVVQIIKVWSRDGEVDNNGGHPWLYIKPAHTGNIIVHSTLVKLAHNKRDTFTATDTFIAIVPPVIRTIVSDTKYLLEKTIELTLADEITNKDITTEYQALPFSLLDVYNRNDVLLGQIYLNPEMKITAEAFSRFSTRHKIESGDKLGFQFRVRHIATGLELATSYTVYIFK